MTYPVFRLVHKDGLSPKEVAAAVRGLKSFERYGIKAEDAVLSERALENVKLAAELLRALGSKRPVRINTSFLVPGLGGNPDARSNREAVTGIGLIDVPIFLSGGVVRGLEDDVPCRGGFQTGALVTVAGVRDTFSFERGSQEYALEPETAERTVELLVRNAAGHALVDHGPGEQGCIDKSCLMQEHFGIMDFVEVVVDGALDFCRRCEGEIRKTVEILRG